MKIEIPELAAILDNQEWLRKATEKLIEQNETIIEQNARLLTGKTAYSISEFALQTGLSKATIQKKIYSGDIKATQVFRKTGEKLGKWTIPAAELFKFIKTA